MTKKSKRTELTRRIDDIIFTKFSLMLDTDKKWTIEEILTEIYLRGIEEGRKQKVSEFRQALEP